MASTRREVRERLVALYTATGVFLEVFGYAPMDLDEAHPVLVIYNKSTNYDFASADLRNFFYTFYLDVYVKRLSGVNTEDVLDALQETIRNVIKANLGDATWNEIELGEDSVAIFAEVGGGAAYRVERFSLKVKITED